MKHLCPIIFAFIIPSSDYCTDIDTLLRIPVPPGLISAFRFGLLRECLYVAVSKGPVFFTSLTTLHSTTVIRGLYKNMTYKGIWGKSMKKGRKKEEE
jgi:hypothetical protein